MDQKRIQAALMKQFDAPITGLSEDQFDRSDFSSNIAKAIRNIDVRGGSFTIAITGDWGEGKTSVMNMIVQWLLHNEMSESSKLGVYFSDPCEEWSDGQVADAYQDYRLVSNYADIQKLQSKALELSDVQWLEQAFQKITKDELKAKNALHYFKLKHYCQNHPKVLVFRFSPWVVTKKEQIALNFVSELEKALKGKCGHDVDREIEAVRNRIAALLQVAGTVGDVITGTGAGGVFAGFLNYNIKSRMSQSETLDGLLDRLSIALLNAPRLEKILIVIDDLDRLSPEEAVEMLSVIKGIANLPKTVHLLGFSESELANCLNKTLGIDGHSYLEKIVQQKFALSQITQEDLKRLVFSGIEIEDSASQTLQTDSFENVWRYIVRNYVRTIRDAKSINNSFLFANSLVSKITFAPDLLAVETLKMCEPALYNWLRTNLDREIEEAQNVGTFQNVGPREEYLKNIIGRLKLKQGNEFAMRSLKYLLPEIDFKPNGHVFRSKTSSVDRPFCETTYRPRYFALSESGNAWTRDDLDNNENETVEAKVTRLLSAISKQSLEKQPKLRRRLLEEIDDLLERGDWNGQKAFVALNSKAPELIKYEDLNLKYFMSDNLDKLRGILVRILSRATEVERVTMFRDALNSSSDVTLLCDIARRAFGDVNIEGQRKGEIGFGADETKLLAELINRVESLSETDTFWHQAEPSRIFWFWWGAVGADAPAKFIKSSIATASSRAGVYDLFLSRVLSSNRGLYERIVKKSMKNFVNPKLLYSLALDDKSLNNKIGQNARRFVTAYEEHDPSMD